MGLCRFSYPSDKLLLVSSLYPSRGEKVESQRRENPSLSLSLFPNSAGVKVWCGQYCHLPRARTRLRAIFSDRVITGDWAETCNAWLISRPNAQISSVGGLIRMADFSSLKAILTGRVILKSEDKKAFQKEIDGTWNAVIRTRQPCAFVRVASVEDVANTVKFCVRNKVR